LENAKVSDVDFGAGPGDGAGVTRHTDPAKLLLVEGFDGIVCDLDGVVYRGKKTVPYAVESLVSALSAGVRVVFATNNASRTPAEVAAQLHQLGLSVPASHVVTSAEAGARHLSQRFGAGARVLAVGGQGVRVALQDAGLTVVPAQGASAVDPVVAVLQGYGADVAWTDLAEVAYAVQAGALWVATNVDSTLPTERGVAPGNGALVAAVRSAVDVDPIVVGKPFTPLYDLSVRVLGIGVERTLAIGDRLDTDIRGAGASGIASLFVFGGVHRWADVVGAGPAARPHYIATDLRSLHASYEEPVQEIEDPSWWVCGNAHVQVTERGDLVVSRGGTLNERLRAALSALWQAGDVRGAPMDPLSGDGAGLSHELDMALTSGR
jgi:glycerol-1-phosphatase